MSINYQTQTEIDYWQAVSKEKDAPQGLAADVAKAVAVINAAAKIAAESRIKHGKVSADYFAHLKSAPLTAYDDLVKTNKVTLSKYSDKELFLDSARNEAEVQMQMASKLLFHASLPFGSHLLQKYRLELFAWVAARRAIDVTACGFTEHVTESVLWVWKRMDVLLHDKRDEIFDPFRDSKLPLILEPHWAIETRRAISGFWREISVGNYVFVKANENATRADRLRLTQYVDALP